MQRILALQLKRIGDLILTAPALATLRRARPDARLVLVVDSAAASLAPVLIPADRLLVYRKGRPNTGLWRQILTGSFDTTLDFTGTDRSALMTLLARAPRSVTSEKLAGSGWKRRLYRERISASVRNLHTVDYHGAFLEPLGVDGTDPAGRGDLAIPRHDRETVASLLREKNLTGNFAVVHPGSARPEKFWEASHWARTIAHLQENLGLPCVLSGGPDPREQAHIRDITEHLRPGAVADLSGKLSLPQLAALIDRATLALGVDTAAMHLAGALEKPQVVLFGPTNPFHWRPRHPKAVVLLAGVDRPLSEFVPRHDAAPMSALAPEVVFRAIDASGFV